jgi:hypothetical protein
MIDERVQVVCHFGTRRLSMRDEKQRDYMPIDLDVKGKERAMRDDLCVFALCIFQVLVAMG